MVTIRKEKERDTRSHAGLSFEKSPLKSSMVPSTVPTSTIGWLNLQHATHTDVHIISFTIFSRGKTLCLRNLYRSFSDNLVAMGPSISSSMQ